MKFTSLILAATCTWLVVNGCGAPIEESKDLVFPDDSSANEDAADGAIVQDIFKDPDITIDITKDVGVNVFDITCDTSLPPVPWNPDSDYLEECSQNICNDLSGIFYFNDPEYVFMKLHSVIEVRSLDDTAPACLLPESHYIAIRVLWHDFFADPADNGSIYGIMPCGGHCHPSTGKFFLINTITDEVLYLGDQDSSQWDAEGLDTKITSDGIELDVSSDKTYVFARSSIPLCADGSNFATNTLYTCGQSNWVVSFLEVRESGDITKSIHFPLDATPGDCPLEQRYYYDWGFGQCANWHTGTE